MKMKDILMVMVFDENLSDDWTFGHVDKVCNEEKNSMLKDLFLHVEELWRSKSVFRLN
jgi:hypothetical protein